MAERHRGSKAKSSSYTTFSQAERQTNLLLFAFFPCCLVAPMPLSILKTARCLYQKSLW
jgi:hypothetical protein